MSKKIKTICLKKKLSAFEEFYTKGKYTLIAEFYNNKNEKIDIDYSIEENEDIESNEKKSIYIYLK